MDYKELIKELRNYTYWLGQSGPESHEIHPLVCEKAATAIETLLKEREAAIEDLRDFCSCSTCSHSFSHTGEKCEHGLDCLGQYWEWRGPTN